MDCGICYMILLDQVFIEKLHVLEKECFWGVFKLMWWTSSGRLEYLGKRQCFG